LTWRDKIIGIASLAFIQMELHWQERLLNDKKAIEKCRLEILTPKEFM